MQVIVQKWCKEHHVQPGDILYSMFMTCMKKWDSTFDFYKSPTYDEGVLRDQLITAFEMYESYMAKQILGNAIIARLESISQSMRELENLLHEQYHQFNLKEKYPFSKPIGETRKDFDAWIEECKLSIMYGRK